MTLSVVGKVYCPHSAYTSFFIMTKDATLDPTVLVDDLVTDVIDGLRNELHPLFGVRAFNLSTVTRTWSGSMVGQGTYTDVQTTLSPQPLIEPWAPNFILGLSPDGVDADGDIMVKEVSLAYTYQELTGYDPASTECTADNVQFFYLLEGAHGQGFPEKRFSIKKPPFPDRVKNMGWEMVLTAET